MADIISANSKYFICVCISIDRTITVSVSCLALCVSYSLYVICFSVFEKTMFSVKQSSWFHSHTCVFYWHFLNYNSKVRYNPDPAHTCYIFSIASFVAQALKIAFACSLFYEKGNVRSFMKNLVGRVVHVIRSLVSRWEDWFPPLNIDMKKWREYWK